MWPWTVFMRAIRAARHTDDTPIGLIFATLPPLWTCVLLWPGTILRQARFSPLDRLGHDEVYASILGTLTLGLWLGLCRVIPRSVYRAVIVAGVGWWLFVGSSLLAGHRGLSLGGWSFMANALYGVLAFLSTSQDYDAETRRLIDRMVREDVLPACHPRSDDDRGRP